MVGRHADAQLVARTLAGDTAAAGRLFDRHWPATVRAAGAVTADAARAEDAAAEAWLRAIDRLASCQPATKFGPWLRRIAVNCAIDAIRADRRLTALGDEPSPAPERDDDGELRAAVRRLPLERRVVVALRFWADLSLPEIAEALDIPLGTASSRLTRGVEDLRRALQGVVA